MRKCFILHVEDDADDVFFFSDALRRSGIEFPVEVARDGQAAIDSLVQAGKHAADPERLSPCVVLLDLNLPRKTGLEVLTWIRRESLFPTLTVIILTSSTSESDMHQAYLLGANSYIVKPTDATKLREIGQLLKAYWFGWNQLPPLLREGGR